jgi:hypothetical protein
MTGRLDEAITLSANEEQVDTAKDNPEQNRLPAGLAEEALAKAIQTSGYPLQTRAAADLIAAGFSVHEEWAYLDGQTPRALDLHAEYVEDEWWQHDSHIYPIVELLVECKRSELPYVFFGGIGERSDWSEAVQVAGLRHQTIATPYPSAIAVQLGLTSSSLATGPEHICSTLSHAQRKGADLELSGSELFNGVVLPLTKALRHAGLVAAPPPRYTHFSCRLQIPICVMEAPMVAATTAANTDLTLVPWIRLFRHEAPLFDPNLTDDDRRGQLVAIDFVHAAYFPQYLRGAVRPTAELFASEVLSREELLLSGGDEFGDLEDEPETET